jgi:hypothetical protein
MAKKQLVLVPSKSMDSSDKSEAGVIRIPAKAREVLSFGGDKNAEVWPVGARQEKTLSLNISQAYNEDLRKAKELIAKGAIKADNLSQIAFVTTKTWEQLNKKTVWISNEVPEKKVVPKAVPVVPAVEPTTVGADPEFLLFEPNADKVVRANNILSHETVVGSDGAMAELRPKPAVEVEDFISNIRSLLKDHKHTQKIESYRWLAHCYHKDGERDYPVGGHIHVGNPDKVTRMGMENRKVFFRTMNKILDELLGVPMIRLDGTDRGNARRTKCAMGKYGYFGEWREAGGRLEYRTLSGMWLAHPEISACVIGTAKAITDEVFARWNSAGYKLAYIYPEEFSTTNPYEINFDGWKEIPLCKDLHALASSREIKTALDESKVGSITKKNIDEWHRTLRTFSTYGKYAQYINGLKEVLSVPIKELEGIETNIKKTWLEGEPLPFNL